MRPQHLMIIGAIVFGLLALMWMILAAQLNEKFPNTLDLPLQDEEYSFDYVIVGAGTCGCVVASLLAQYSKHSILLIEAGEQFGFLSKIPLLATFQQKGLNDWGFLSVSQRHSSKGLHEERQCLPRGKGIGGSAQMNYMLHFDGRPEDFERWSNVYNLSEWRWESMRPFLDAAKDSPAHLFNIDAKYSKVTEALASAEEEFSHKPWSFRRSVYTIKKGLRYGVVQRFLQPALEKYRNLFLMPNTFARNLRLTAKKVKHLWVSMRKDGKEHHLKIEVRKELILSAGAYHTPQLLLASGIGQTSILSQHGIRMQREMPRVGKNLHDHFNQPLFVSIDVTGPTLNQRALLDPYSLFSYVTSGTGHLGNFGVLGHLDAARFGLTFFGAGAIDESVLMSISNFKRDAFRALFPRYHNATQEGFVVLSTCLQPQSRGSVRLSNIDMRQPPLIDPNYLSAMADVKCTIEAIRAAVEIVNSTAFRRLGARIHWPRIKACVEQSGAAANDFKNNNPNDSYLECLMRNVGLGSHHPGGSCSLGTSAENSVVDAQFRVHGIGKLRIIDASVLPTPISGNPSSILVAMAIRGAKNILKSERN